MKKLILHIGCEKTGTTSIQNTLAANRYTLENKYGYYYPTSLGHKNHTKLAIYCCNEDKNLSRFLPRGVSLDEFRKNLQEEFVTEIQSTSAKTVIISCEWLHPRLRDESEFRRLKFLLSDLFEEVFVLLYIRRQDKLAMSLYSTSLKAGNYRPFSFPQITENGDLPYALDFLEIYRRWKYCFVPDGMQVRVFDRKVLYGNDVVKDFLMAVDCGLGDIRFYQDDNRSLNTIGIAVMRALNLILHWSNKVVKSSVARKLRHWVASFFYGHAELASEHEMEIFLKNFEQVNSELEREYWEDSNTRLKL